MANKKLSVALQVIKGGLIPGDLVSRSILNQSGLRVGHLVRADIDAPRRPEYYRLAHKFSSLCRANIGKFSNLAAHDVLKTLQLESGAGCEFTLVRLGDVWHTLKLELSDSLDDSALNSLEDLFKGREHLEVPARVPRSLSFESMSEDEFRSIFQAVCSHVSERYWPELSPDQIARMAETMPNHDV